MTIKTKDTKKGRKYTIGTNEYDSVTTPLSILSFPGLAIWKARIGKTKAERYARKAARRGTVIHNYCEQICLGKTPKVNKKYKDSVDAFKKWFDENVEEVIEVEKVVWSDKYKVAGRYDFLGRLKGRKGLAVIDWKTGKIKREHFLQLAAYRALTGESTDIPLKDIKHRIVLSVKDGKVKEVEPKGKANADWKVYLKVLDVWRWSLNVK